MAKHLSIQTKFLRLSDNLIFTVKVVNRLLKMQLELGIGTTTWKKFQTAIAIRNRITHPKKVSDIDISDDEIEICKEVSGWFNNIVAIFIQNLVNLSTSETGEVRNRVSHQNLGENA
ncbi:hypothetical protein QUA57_11990 [Microcoleus sp. Pol7_B2]